MDDEERPACSECGEPDSANSQGICRDCDIAACVARMMCKHCDRMIFGEHVAEVDGGGSHGPGCPEKAAHDLAILRSVRAHETPEQKAARGRALARQAFVEAGRPVPPWALG